MNEPIAAGLGALGRRCAVLCLALGGHAAAQLIPDKETGGQMVRAKLIDGQLELRDLEANRPLIVPRGMKLLTDLDPRLSVQTTLQEQPTGADLIFTFTNPTSDHISLGMIKLGIITLGPELSYLDTKFFLDFVPSEVSTFVGQAWSYPDWAYSPVWVLQSPEYAMGISLQYPILEYEHETRLSISNPRGEYLIGEGGRGWSVHFGLSTTGSEYWQRVGRGGSVPPGASRTYVVSVRVSKNPSEWLRTLVPYRDFFRGTYGGVTYTRRTTPILGVGMSGRDLCTPENPHGWAPEFRPDLYGWSKFTTFIKTYRHGWSSVMLWTPSGHYMNNRAGNYPPQICTPWLETPALSTAFDPVNGLPSLVKAGKELGIWWGRSAQVAPGNVWDPPSLESFDPDRADHLQSKIRELDLAVQAGCRVVGLDTFSAERTAVWKLYAWLRFMRLRHPDVSFMMESRPCDVLHTLGGAVLNGWNDLKPPTTPEDLYSIKHPLWLADFLLPGHETYAVYRYSEWQQYYGITATPDRVIADMQRHAAFGFTPIMQAPGEIPPVSIEIARPWEQTVPADLQLPDTPVPFGPVRDGSGSVALGTSFAAKPGGGLSWPEVRGFKPGRPAGTGISASPAALSPPSPSGAEAAPGETVPTDDLSRKVVVRRAGKVPVRAKDAAQPDDAPPPEDGGVRTFRGTGGDKVTVVLPPTPRPRQDKP